jgi:hypothetical protein
MRHFLKVKSLQSEDDIVTTIVACISGLRQKIYNIMAQIKLMMSAGKRTGGAGEVLQFAHGQSILQARKKLHVLRANTEKDEILTGKLINIQLICKKDIPNNTLDWVRQGFLNSQ